MPTPGGATSVLTPGSAGPLLIACPILAGSLMLPWQGQWICAVVVVTVLGVPHGALDVEIARNLFRERLGRAWFPVFALPYLTLVAFVLAAWHVVPGPTLAAFLVASVWHFGTEDSGAGGLPALAQGGIPIALPVLLHPEATAQVLSAASGLTLATPPSWLIIGSLMWGPAAALWAIRAAIGGQGRSLLLPAAVCAAFAVLPPLTAFTLYFVAVHAPAHTACLIRHPTRAPRALDTTAAWRLSMPITALTVLIGAALWTVTPGEAPVRVVRVTLQLLAALTLPHMLFDACLRRRDEAHSVRTTSNQIATI